MDFAIKEPKGFTEQVRKLEPTDPAHADTFNVPYEALVNNDAYLKEKVELLQTAKANKSAVTATVLPADGWTGADVPYRNTISVPGATEDNNIELTVPNDITAEQVAAYQAAQLCGGMQGTDSITVHAWGEAPEIDLPIIAAVRGDM